MTPKHLSIKDFTYDLPEDRIAKFPLAERDGSKLLMFKNGQMSTSIYSEIDQLLPEKSLLVFNDTKVVEARLIFQKPTGGVIEIFCLEPGDEYADITTAMLQKKKVLWKCLVGGAAKWKNGIKLVKHIDQDENKIELHASIIERLSDCFIIELTWQPESMSFAEILHVAGLIPLPPYLRRDANEGDKNSYQTIYAAHDGSVAAPTAGLHFTEKIFKKLEEKSISKTFVTLHVGAGTFKPVKSETLADHDMHTEFIDVTIDAIESIIYHLNKTIVAVGTTSLRTIESLYWMGLKVVLNNDILQEELIISQWEVYDTTRSIPAEESLNALIKWMKKNRLQRLISKTQILIAPGYQLKIAKGIITNFHQPQSTLLLLIAAIVGDKWKDIYAYAMENDFRFLSYGDGCLLWKE